jgi:type IV pilus assembly protein PilA
MVLHRLYKGFTLIELMIVVAIIGIMATMAIPTYQDYLIRAQITEATGLADSIKKSIHEYYQTHQRFPADNEAAGVPKAEYLIGNFVSGITVENGAIHITLGHYINVHAAGKILTLRPATVINSPNSPISWLCGYTDAVNGMQAAGENKTDLPGIYLSPGCRRR